MTTDRRLRRRERIRKRNDIKHVFSEGVRCRRSVLSVAAVRNDLEYSRLGVGASVKLCNAVKRNRLKRLAREAFRLNKAGIPVGLDIFVMVAEAGAELADVERDLMDAVRTVDRKLRNDK